MIMGAQILGHASPNFQDFAAARGAAGEMCACVLDWCAGAADIVKP